MENRKDAASKQTGKDLMIKERNSNNKQVKLCGYLRKKRNKIGGGWRKMWFVLQDKLLLSYGSKEEYDNKLVSFKDVLNLVPGTMVHALDGCRFTIETTTQVVYTFHCDGYTVYREWITTLLDSIATYQHSSSVASAQIAPMKFFNYSMDNIPNESGILAQASKMRRNKDITSSYDSISSHVERSNAKRWLGMDNGGGGVSGGGGYVRLPIAQTTTCIAKILERNDGMHSSSNAQQQRRSDFCKRRDPSNGATTNNGPLERKIYLPANDENDIGIDSEDNHHLQCNLEIGLLCSESRDSCVPEMMMISKRKFLSERRQQLCEKKKKGVVAVAVAAAATNKIEHNTEITSCNEACKALGVVKDRIQRLSLKGSRDLTVDSLIATAGERGAVERKKHSILMTTSTDEHHQQQQQNLIMPKYHNVDKEDDQDDVHHPKGNNNLFYKNNNNNNNITPTAMGEPIYAVIDLKNKYAQRKMRKAAAALTKESDALKRCNSYDSIIQKPGNKYETNGKSLSLTEDDIDGIYEDGDKFLTSIYVPIYHGGNSKTHKTKRQSSTGSEDAEENDDGEENIYEPINVRSNVAATHPAHTTSLTPFWKYFTRLKVNSLLQLTRKHRDGRNATYDVLKPVVSPKVEAPTKFPTQFTTNIKHKFGIHRRSMQMRMRKFCSKDYEPKPFFKMSAVPTAGLAATTTNNNTTSNTKYRWRSMKFSTKNLQKGEMSKIMGVGAADKKRRQFFGSLPHLKRKSRVSLFDASKMRASSRVENRVEESGANGGRGSCSSSASNYSENSLDYKENSMKISVNGNHEDIEV